MSEPLEIERVFLLRGLPALPGEAVEDELLIEQGYLPFDEAAGKPEGRLRRVRRRDGSERFVHTVKEGFGLVRIERERSIDRAAFESDWPRTAGRRLSKTRWRVRWGTLLWEIDRFDGIDLVLAEVELPAPDTPVELPPWLAPEVVREVTEEPAYRNSAIALRVHGGSASELR